jgi:putative ABC transport system permease protein
MDALDRKLLRDFRRLWAQALAIALVLACGVAVLVTTFGMQTALENTRRAYYEGNRFADVFAATRRAPLSLMAEIGAIDGVLAAEARVQGAAILDLPGRVQPAVGQIISLPPGGASVLNLPILRSGRLPDPGAANEVAVNEPFAEANGFRPGDTFLANLNGRQRTLTITGTMLSPEFIYTIGPGDLMPNNEGFGILWMPERAAAAAFDMAGAFNFVSLSLAGGANATAVMERLDDILEPYGGLGAYDRRDQQSNAFIDAEITQLRSLSFIMPPVFFGISAFLVNMVIGRIVALERSEIGLLKALGYSDVEISVHYLLLAGLVAVAGVLIGWAAGNWLSRSMAALYADFFDFPFLIYSAPWSVYVVSGLLGLATAALGAAQSARRAAALPPAVAMAPPAPPRFRRTVFDRAMQALSFSQPMMMIVRSFVRWPVRSALSGLGIAAATAILIAANFFNDSLDALIDTAFYQANRQDVMLLFAEDVPETALEDIRRLPGVLAAEGQQFHAAILRHGPVEKRVPIEARRPGTDLSRIVSGGGDVVDAPAAGILLSETLAAQARRLRRRRDRGGVPLRPAGNRPPPRLGTVTQYFGLGAYMDLETLNRIFRQAPRISTANLLVDEAALDALHEELKDIPRLTGTIMLTDSRRAFQETIQENVLVMMTIYIAIASLITIGVSYNAARIQLSERAREFASLRILGFTRGRGLDDPRGRDHGPHPSRPAARLGSGLPDRARDDRGLRKRPLPDSAGPEPGHLRRGEPRGARRLARGSAHRPPPHRPPRPRAGHEDTGVTPCAFDPAPLFSPRSQR